MVTDDRMWVTCVIVTEKRRETSATCLYEDGKSQGYETTVASGLLGRLVQTP